MKKFIICILILFIIPIVATAQPLEFSPVGGGKFIYCNNEEGIFDTNLLNGENPMYIMNNENLTPDKYYLYISHINYTGVKYNGKPWDFGYDIELDVELTAVEDATLVIQKAAFETTRVYAFESGGVRSRYEEEWGSFQVCCDMLGVPVYGLDGKNTYIPRDFEPVNLTIKKGETVWLSEYLEDYTTVHFGKPVHIQGLIELLSGELNINVGAFRHNGKLGDRSYYDGNGAFGEYMRDRCFKGVANSLPEVVAELEYEINDDTEDNELIPVTVYNQYVPEGNTVTAWCTNLNTQNDIWSKRTAPESDLLPLYYKDDSKLTYYGSNVPEEERDNVWVFDQHHSDTKGYETGFNTGSVADYRPNYVLDVAKDNLNTSCSLGNYGVAETYKLTIHNNSSKVRYVGLNVTTTSAIIGYKVDESNRIMEANLKPNTADKSKTLILEEEVLPDTTETVYFTFILPVNYYGGILNELSITYDSRFERAEPMVKTEVPLLNGILLKDAEISDETAEFFDGNMESFSYLKGKDNALVRWCAWDGKPYYYYYMWGNANKVYVLDKDGEITGEAAFDVIPVAASFKDGVYYVELADGRVMQSEDGTEWAIYNGKIPEYIPWYDVEKASDWARRILQSAYDSGIALNYDEGYHFTDNITRYDFCRLAYSFLKNLNKLPENVVGNVFPDTESVEISALVSAGVIYGFDDGNFRPDEEITREQAATILDRLTIYLSAEFTESDDGFVYADNTEISDWALPSVMKMKNISIMVGIEDGKFGPALPYTREQAVVTIYRLLGLIK